MVCYQLRHPDSQHSQGCALISRVKESKAVKLTVNLFPEINCVLLCFQTHVVWFWMLINLILSNLLTGVMTPLGYVLGPSSDTLIHQKNQRASYSSKSISPYWWKLRFTDGAHQDHTVFAVSLGRGRGVNKLILKNPLPTIFLIHELTDTPDWLVWLRLTEKKDYATPPIQRNQICSLGLPTTNGCDIVRI